ncbi:MAG: GNAT family N-acetyltransferase [Ferruginibacter sp.]
MLQVRKAAMVDVDLIQQLAHDTWPIAYKGIITPGQIKYMLELIYSKPSLSRQIEILHHQFVIIYESNRAIGFASYSVKENSDNDIFRLHKLYVLPLQMGKGIGKSLLTFVIDQAKQQGAGILELNVNRKNPAIDFYKKQGFEVAWEEDIDIGEGYFMNDYVMEKNLTPALSEGEGV